MSKPYQLTAPENIHPYVFRTASTTDHRRAHGRRDDRQAQGQARRDDEPRLHLRAGRDRRVRQHLKKIKPDMEIVDQQWPKLGEADYTPFINAQTLEAARGVVHVAVGRPLRDLHQAGEAARLSHDIKPEFIVAGGEAGSIESAKAIGVADYPLGIWGNAYDVFNWDDGPAIHKDFVERVKNYTKDEYPSSWPTVGYVAMQVLVEAIKKANSAKSDDVAKALLGSHRRYADRQADHQRQESPGQSRPVLGQDGEGPEVSVRGHEGHPLRRPSSVHRLTVAVTLAAACDTTPRRPRERSPRCLGVTRPPREWRRSRWHDA